MNQEQTSDTTMTGAAPAGNIVAATPVVPGTMGAPAAPAAPAAAPAPAATDAVPTADLGLEPAAPKTPNPDVGGVYDYDPTGNSSLDYALNFVGKLGYGPDHPAVIAAEAGNFDLMRAELAQKGVAGSEAVMALAEKALAEERAKYDAQAQALTNFAHTAAGGEQNWKAVQTWAKANATPQEKAEVNRAIQAGGMMGQAVINFLIESYQKSNTLNRTPQSAVSPGAAPAMVSSGGPLSKQDYTAAVAALNAKHRGRATQTTEYADLQQRRLQGMRAGL